eukprot:Gb_19537 [translate_table: standard]
MYCSPRAGQKHSSPRAGQRPSSPRAGQKNYLLQELGRKLSSPSAGRKLLLQALAETFFSKSWQKNFFKLPKNKIVRALPSSPNVFEWVPLFLWLPRIKKPLYSFLTNGTNGKVIWHRA